MANSIGYNPDVLSTLANLSSDEVFTPPEVAKAMLDLVPQELFKDPNTKFFDPATKTGVFLREIARRLKNGLKEEIPDLQKRLDHIYKNQIFGIAITELTGLMSRRSLYCSKHADGPYSVATTFNNSDGNIRFERIEHDWDSSGKCTFCGASKEQFDRGSELETHAYEFIHIKDLKELEKMKFDLIISNPPYQLETQGAGRQARPIYHLFVEQAKKLRPRYLSMITPSRWFAGGMGLDTFRSDMMNDKHIRVLVDYLNGKDCFPQSSVGGVNYFLWDRDNPGQCEFTNIIQGKRNTMMRDLNTHSVLVRFNEGISILSKVQHQSFKSIQDIISPLMPFGLGTDYRGRKRKNPGDYTLHASTGISYVSPEEVPRGHEYIDYYKILISKTSSEHAGEPSEQGDFKVLTSSMKVIGPGEICTHSYFIIGRFESSAEAENLYSYLCTKFVRFLLLLSISSINLSKLVFTFVPLQDFSKSWTDEELYRKYHLEEHEIEFIESIIKPM